MFSRVECLLITIFFVVFFALRWNSINMPFERDEGEYAYSGWLLRHNISPYEHSFLQKPPMIIYIYALGQIINETALWPPRVIAIFFDLITIFLIGLLAKKEIGKEAAWVAVFLASVMFVFPILNPFAANTERFMLLPLMGLITLERFYEKTLNKRVFFFAGILASTAFLIKPICLSVIILSFLLWLWGLRDDLKKIVNLLIFFGLGFAITSILMGVYFFLNGSWQYMIEEVFVFNKYYAGSWNLSHLYFYILYFLYYWNLFFAILIIGLFFGIRGYKKIIIRYLGFTVAATTVLITAKFGHYYFLVLPFLCLLGSISFVAVSKRFYPIKKNGCAFLVNVDSSHNDGGLIYTSDIYVS